MKIELTQDEFNLEMLNDFLIDAKKNGYASGNKPLVKDGKGGGTFIFERGNLKYTDTYQVGPNDVRFIGLERVYAKVKRRIGMSGIQETGLPTTLDVPVWGMAYHGGITVSVDKEREEEINSFLRKCLLQVPSGFPIRGPIGKPVIEDNLRYDNFSNESDLSKFSGVEIITLTQEDGDKKTIHEVNYCGGLL